MLYSSGNQLCAYLKLADGRAAGSNTEVGIHAIDDATGIGVAEFASSIKYAGVPLYGAC
jgi:hypothetical protein